jgi:UDP-N-acetylmuramoyl-tripeptide--D-alanyl-D-alanine ligase
MPVDLVLLPIVAIWVYVIWRRLYRLIRYFQLEGYASRRYLNWLSKQRAEVIFIAANLVIGTLSVLATLFLRDGIVESNTTLFWGLWLLNAIVGPVFIAFAPRDSQAKQNFTRTSRATRLLVTALLVSLVCPAIVSAVSVVAWAFQFPPGLLIFWRALAFCGALGLFIVPFALPLANLINWPIEEAFRRYYLALAERRLRASGATVIALTGSFGKTSTKHYLNHILSGRYRTLMTPKSYNTLLGISRVINEILADDASYDYFIVEAGAYIPGEIARICKLVKPTIGMVITVGPMHLERFGSMDNIVRAKYEIIESLPHDGLGIFNGDDPRVRGMADRGFPDNRILVSQKGAVDARITAVNVMMQADGLYFDLWDHETGEAIKHVHAPLYGEHNVTNMLMAVAVARHLRLSLPEIKMRIATLEPAEHRLVRRVLPDGTVIIDDAYSANPIGTQMALSVLALQNQDRPTAKRIVISSGMFELGPISDDENCKLGERIAKVATDVILIGKTVTVPVLSGLTSAGFPSEHLHVVDSLDAAVKVYREFIQPGDALLMLTDLPDLYA